MEDWIADLGESGTISNPNSNIYLPPKGKRKVQTLRKPYFWGLHFNQWHLVLAFIAINATWVILMAVFGGNIWWQLLYLLVGIAVSHWLQSWNEIRQAYDPFLATKYGSWSHFLVDSQKDWYYYWRGVWVSPIPMIIWAFIRSF